MLKSMSFKLQSKKLKKLIFFITFILITASCVFLSVKEALFSNVDFRILDLYYQKIVKNNHGPKQSAFPQIKYVTITDDTYSYIKKNYLDRSFLATVNNTLTELGVEAIAYDILFPRPTNPGDDQAFETSILNSKFVYLPIGLDFSAVPVSFDWKPQFAYERFKTEYLKLPVQRGKPKPFYGTWALMQYEPFDSAAFNSGHISAYSDIDGSIRQMLMLIKVKDKFFPALSLSMFLDYAGVPFETIIVDWGRHITIPALKESLLKQEIVIPIDKKGLATIPYCQTWVNSFEEIPAHILVEKMKDENLYGNLTEIFEGNFVFIGDISVGISDLSNTPLQNNVPLLVSHTAMLNAMLTNTFYTKWSFISCMLLIICIGILMGLSALFKSSWPLYATIFFVIAGICILTWFQFTNFKLFPIVTILGTSLFMASGLIILIQVVTQKDRAFIQGVFSTYVPDKIVDHLLINPDLLTLGGENHEITLMMSDIRGYTALSCDRTPNEIIIILNRYFEKMFDIIMEHDGIINEIIGDGILAFFGAPEHFDDHPAKAVACALSMQNAMEEINLLNNIDGLPNLEMGIGLNTGVVVVGNIGSKKRAQYGVTGSEVNLTGRTESCTVGGQVLITTSVYDRLSHVLRVKKTMTVDMKGMSQKVDLYDVTGIGEPYNLYLKENENHLVEMNQSMNIDLYRLNKKIVSKKGLFARIKALCISKAAIIISEELNPLENIRIHILEDGKNIDNAQIYAKVSTVEKSDENFQVLVDFTSVSPMAEKIISNRLK